MRSAPLSAVLREAADPHSGRGKTLVFHPDGPDPELRRQPAILRRPEVIHGLRNLVQNAVDFAASRVWIDLSWTGDRITIRITDDGPGYPPHVLPRIGDPFVRHRRESEGAERRPGYDGMGLGLFIAKTLLERTGARLVFSNGTDPFLTDEEKPQRSGAVVEVSWPRAMIEATDAGLQGENSPIDG